MNIDKNALKKRVFEHFEALCKIPHGSGNMDKIAQHCVDFANKNFLKVIRDKANNIIIFKEAAKGYESSPTVILQGHLDMVCQRENGCNIDFGKEGLQIFADGDYIKAKGTTLGADNGIAVSYILTILESDNIPHPAIEAVFTADEEIGMVGAAQLDASLLCGKRLINLDSERDDTLTVSCAGGTEFIIDIPVNRKAVSGTQIEVVLCGLKGGHSGIEINKGRQNANILAGRFLNYMQAVTDFELISIDGGEKSNAITPSCSIKLCTKRPEKFIAAANAYLNVIKAENAAREPGFCFEINSQNKNKHLCLDKKIKEQLIFLLACAPNGVVEMSADVEGLVETSLNLGILKTNDDIISLDFSVRSNKQSAMEAVIQKLKMLSTCISCSTYSSGFYPPWEYKDNSSLQKLYTECFTRQFGKAPKVEAIHAGLECGVFCAKIPDLECIAIGPTIYDVHTVNERLKISSAEQIFQLLLNILGKIK